MACKRALCCLLAGCAVLAAQPVLGEPVSLAAARSNRATYQPQDSLSGLLVRVAAATAAGDEETPDVQALMKRMDENDDGLVSEDEFKEVFKELFEDAHAHHGHGHEDEHDDHGDEHEIEVKHPKDKDGKCFGPDAIMTATAGANGSLNATELAQASMILTDMKLEGCVIKEEDECKKDEAGIIWLLGLTFSIGLSLLSLATVALFPLADNKWVMSGFMAFAVGALMGDAIMHLIPAAFGVHAHGGEGEEEESEDEKAYLGPATVILTGILFYFVLNRELPCVHDHAVHPTEEVEESRVRLQRKKANDVEDLGDSSDGEDDSADSEESTQSSAASEGSWYKNIGPWFKKYEPIGYISLLSDALCNFTDGIAVGAAFTISIGSGIGTAIAVFCHELPQELSEFTILIGAGFSKQKAVMWNVATGFSNLLGTVIGLGVGQAIGNGNKYMVAFVAGGFIYISIGNLVPVLLKETGTKQTILQCCAILMGFTLLLIIAIFEESITFPCAKDDGHDDHDDH